MDMFAIDRSVERVVTQSVAAAWSRKLSFLLITIAAFACAAVAILSLRPTYESATLLLAGQVSPDSPSGASRPPMESPAVLIQMASSDEVLRMALNRPGVLAAIGEVEPDRLSLFTQMRAKLFGTEPPPPRLADPQSGILLALKRRLSVRSDPNSNVIRIAFRHPDPAVAVQLVNAISAAFMDRQVVLGARPGAAAFFDQQRQRFDAELREASIALDRFSSESGLYTIDQQRELLLRRRNDLALAMAINRAAIADKIGQRQTLAAQLRRLAPVARSNYVSSLVDALGGDPNATPNRIGEVRGADDRTADPPLLLVRVYQDSMVTLFRLNAELTGAQNLQAQQQQEEATINAQLARLSEQTPEFETLRRAVQQATHNAELYARRMIEEQIGDQLHAARFSSLRVLDQASEANRPIFPNYQMFFVAAGLMSLVFGFLATQLWRRR
ncbi:hypothetical protein ACLF3G_28880 [Falsiroseomonas sp. HC035]|uniref:hypothetical protein n=1 Tax=Falsiroseomonas sp. HC035 TaxID=3390999 RepID=UPI003D31BE78